MLIETDILDTFNISLNEYKLCDLIFRSQTLHPFSKTYWCMKKKNELAKELGVAKIYVYKMLNRLIAIGLVEKYPIQSGPWREYIKVTDLWLDEVAKIQTSTYTQIT